MTWKHTLRLALQRRLGLDIVRYPGHDPIANTGKLLSHYEVNCVVDIGANIGRFASSLREVGYEGRIVSFEPLSKPFAILKKRAATDRNWEAHRYAIGATKDKVSINIAANTGLSSSVLPMLKAHTDAAPGSHYIDKETVDQDRLDSLLPNLGLSSSDRIFIKMDVQGYEAAVLDGASELLASPTVVGIQLELSLTLLYEGAMTYREGLARADAMGMNLMGLSPVLTNPESGRLLQFDSVFFREHGHASIP